MNKCIKDYLFFTRLHTRKPLFVRVFFSLLLMGFMFLGFLSFYLLADILSSVLSSVNSALMKGW